MKLGASIIALFRNRPDKLDELGSFEQSTKQSAISSLLTNERIIDESMEIAMQKVNMELHRGLDRIRNRITAIRHSIESATLLIYPNSAIKVNEVISNVATFHIAVVYQSFVIEASTTMLRDELEFDPEIETKSLLLDIRNGATALESIWKLRPKAAMNENISKTLKEQLKGVSSGIVEVIEKISLSSQAQLDLAFKEVSLKKPRLLGKGKYSENLGDLMIGTIKVAGQSKMNLIDIRENILSRYPKIDLQINDMEEAAKILYERKIIFAVREDSNTQIIELKKSEDSPKCGSCGKERGYMIEFYTCPITDGYVCTEDVSFFGNCKVCGKKLKHGHELVT